MIWQRGYYLHSVVVFSYRRLILTRWIAVVSQWYCVEVAFLGSLLYSLIFVIPRLKGKGSPVIAKDCRGGASADLHFLGRQLVTDVTSVHLVAASHRLNVNLMLSNITF